ncbi:MAG: NADH-quinone oxidoreductase subunit J [Planctomycetota bacterium]
MGAQTLLFWLFAAMTISGGLMAVLLPSIQQAVFSLLMSFVGVAAIYALAGADFLAITQIVVYVGGILVLLSFGILLTGRTAMSLGPQEMRNRPLGVAFGILIFGGLLWAITHSSGWAVGGEGQDGGTTAAIGRLLLTRYLVAFEFAAIMLLTALVGAAYLVRRTDA